MLIIEYTKTTDQPTINLQSDAIDVLLPKINSIASSAEEVQIAEDTEEAAAWK